MAAGPLLLCPIDFSSASRGALHNALAIADRAGGQVLLLTVDDPILEEAAAAARGAGWSRRNSERELRQFLAETLGPSPAPRDLQVEVATGKPDVEILRVARERSCALIVMSTQGRSGPNKLLFGSTAERVLRGTTVPVLLTPGENGEAATLAVLGASDSPVLVPVDFSDATTRQVEIARQVAAALKQPLVFAHVVEPLHMPKTAEIDLTGMTAERMSRAKAELTKVAGNTTDAMIAEGNPAMEIARIARERRAGLIVIGLHGEAFPGPRIGSVTYRLLSLGSAPALAIPPGSRLAVFS